jgi:Ca-activated chloride channel family protein
MPEFEYARWDGTQEFKPLVADELFEQLSEYLLEYGEYMMPMLDQLAEQQPEALDMLLKEGYVEKDEQGRYRISPKGIRRVEEKALDELFTINKKDSMGKHETPFRGAGQVVHEESKAYEYGDPVANLNMHETLKNALVRQGGGTPIDVDEDDFVVYDTEFQTTCSTVLLLDMSGSMARYGKFYHAKKVAMALQGLVRGRYREDFFQVVGFYSYASAMTERELLYCAPKEVSIFDSRVHLRIDLQQPPRFVPQHFTNIHAGLRFARRQLARQPGQNKQIIVVTDGEPTAHLEGNDLLLIYPPSERTAKHTLAEVQECTKAGIHISSFALVEDYFYLGLVNFVEQMARLNRGVAAYCTAGQLGKFVLDSFAKGRRTRRVVG